MTTILKMRVWSELIVVSLIISTLFSEPMQPSPVPKEPPKPTKETYLTEMSKKDNEIEAIHHQLSVLKVTMISA